MQVDWTPHRFSGGALALDTANTVVLRGDPVRSFDRFDNIQEIKRFAEAASSERREELGHRPLVVSDLVKSAPMILRLREAVDRLFRTAAVDSAVTSRDLAALLSACAAALAKDAKPHERLPFGSGPRIAESHEPLAFDTALALSALALLPVARDRRIRICAHCRWLFVDESRNRSRIWCDMAVCGNRAKAKRHYRRKRRPEEGHAENP